MKEANRTQITETICKQAQLMRKGGANQTEIGKLLGINPCTVSRMEKAGFDLATYQANRRMEKQKEKEKAAKQTVVELVYDPSIAEEYRKEQEAKAAEELPGQMQMDLTPEKPEMSDQTKMMRFQAGQVEKLFGMGQLISQKMMENATGNAILLNTKLDKLNDTLCMILRAIRKE